MSDKDPSLFDYAAKARRSDPQTSHDAAASVKRIRESQQAILNALTDHGPMTDEEIIATGVAMSPSGARTRRKELVSLGKVHDTGATKLTKSGRKTIVWGLL